MGNDCCQGAIGVKRQGRVLAAYPRSTSHTSPRSAFAIIRLAEVVFEKGLVSDAVNRLIVERWPIKIPRPADDFVENLALVRCPETLKRLQDESYCSAHALRILIQVRLEAERGARATPHPKTASEGPERCLKSRHRETPEALLRARFYPTDPSIWS